MLRENLPAQRLGPEPRQHGQVVSINDDVVKADRHAASMRRGAGSHPANTPDSAAESAGGAAVSLGRVPTVVASPAGQFVEPPGVVAWIEPPVLCQGAVEVVADHGGDHVHDVVPVVALAGQPLNGLPCLGRVVGQQLTRDDLVQ